MAEIVHPMTQMFIDNPQKFVALIIWALRKKITNLVVEITADDIAKLGSLGDYAVTIRGKVNGIEFQLVDAESGKAFSLTDEAAAEYPAAQRMKEFFDMKKRAGPIADRLDKLLLHDDAVTEAAQILRHLAIND